MFRSREEREFWREASGLVGDVRRLLQFVQLLVTRSVFSGKEKNSDADLLQSLGALAGGFLGRKEKGPTE